MADRFDKFTASARQVLTFAQEEARKFNHNYIGTEHLLLGLVRRDDPKDIAGRVLSNLGVELSKIRSAVEFIIGRGEKIPEVAELTPRGKRVIELAVDEARRLGAGYIGTEHLLLGLVREGEGIAASVLESLGVNLDRLQAEVKRLLKEQAKTRRTGWELTITEVQERIKQARNDSGEFIMMKPGVSWSAARDASDYLSEKWGQLIFDLIRHRYDNPTTRVTRVCSQICITYINCLAEKGLVLREDGFGRTLVEVQERIWEPLALELLEIQPGHLEKTKNDWSVQWLPAILASG